MPRVYKPTVLPNSTLMQALLLLFQKLNKEHIKTTAKKYFLSPTMLSQRIKKTRENMPLQKQGRSTWLNRELEEKFAMYLRHMSEMGLAPTKDELIGIILHYLTVNEMNDVFKDNKPAEKSRISMHAKIITHTDFIKVEKAKQQSKTKPTKRKIIEDSDSELDEPYAEISSSETEFDESKLVESELDESNVDTLSLIMKRSLIHENLAARLPHYADIQLDEFYGVYWEKIHYWGKVLDILEDENPPIKVQVKFMSRKAVSSDNKQVRWGWPPKEDTAIVRVRALFVGPATPILDLDIKGKQWYRFEEENEAVQRYNIQ